MKNDLKIEQLSPYLPYKLRFNMTNMDYEFICTGLHLHKDGIMADHKGGSTNISLHKYYKPIMRPMSELTRPMLEKAGFVCHIDYLTYEFESWVTRNGRDQVIKQLPYGHAQWLFKNHFDLFGLLPAGLAIDVNTKR